MDLSVALQLVSTLAVVAGVFFAGFQIRLAGRKRAQEAELLLVASFQSVEFMRAMKAIVELPDGLSKAEIEAQFGERDFLIFYWLGTMESLGVLVHHRDLSIRLVDDFFSGPILITWRKLQRYVLDMRAELQRDTMSEWFQWLVERIVELERTSGRTPANISEADWTP